MTVFISGFPTGDSICSPMGRILIYRSMGLGCRSLTNQKAFWLYLSEVSMFLAIGRIISDLLLSDFRVETLGGFHLSETLFLFYSVLMKSNLQVFSALA